jgi:nitrate reductase delta subunit
MIRLLTRYRMHGLELQPGELPDFLPLFLEFLSTCRREQAIKYLSEVGDIIAGIGQRLRKRSVPHAPVLEAIASLVLQDHDALAASSGERERDDTPAALDIAWEEAPVTFNDLALSDAKLPRG